MSIQTDLDEAIAHIKIDTELLHEIVHGDDTTVVTTEGGPVKSSAKTLKDMEQSVQSLLNDLSITMENLQAILHQSQDNANTTIAQAQSVEQTANALNLPSSLTGHQGEVLTVNEAQTGYIFLPSTSICYGFRKSGAKLLVHIDEPKALASTLDDYFIASRGIIVEINTRGHLLLKL